MYKRGLIGPLRMLHGNSNSRIPLYYTSMQSTPTTSLYSSTLHQLHTHSPTLFALKLREFHIQIPDTFYIIEEAWNRIQSFVCRLKHTKIALKKWNHLTFGNIHDQTKKLKTTITTLLASPQNTTTIDAENAAQRDLDELTKREETFWKEKAKTRWIEEGNTNSHCFHLTTVIHRRNNVIHRIHSIDNTWVTDRNIIGSKFIAYFSYLFTSSCPSCPSNLQGLIQPMINEDQNRILCVVLEMEEIRRAVFSMGHYKSPGPDGMTVTFYK